jgi:DNA-binding transcriptional ArsR family regulator
VNYSDVLLLSYLKEQCGDAALELRYATIAIATGISIRTVRRATRRLADAGLISVQREPGDRYTYRVNQS